MLDRYVKLSKKISYALRHHPEEFGLKLDKKGFVKLQDLLDAVNCTREDVDLIIQESEKKRFEIVGDMVRATYGHSVEKKIEKDQATPPAILYHGTAHRFIDSIKAKGLLPMNRQYVHLSEDEKTAVMVGSRHDSTPVILKVDTRKAMNSGVKFYLGNDTTWLADPIPPHCIEGL